jgi:hypothetical protein
VKPEETERFDVLRDVARGHIHLDQTLTDAFALRALREALRLGDPSRMVWALGVEAASEALIGGPYLQRRARALLAQVEALAGRTGTPSDRAYATHIRGVIAFFQGDYAGAEAALLEAQRMFRDHESRTGFVHEINLNIPFLIATFEQRGNIGAMTLLLSELGASARRTGNLRSSFLFRAGSAGLVALARDKPIEAIGEGDAALADWPRADFGASHEYHLVITVSARIYAGLVAEAWEQVERTWPSLERAHFLRMEALGMQLRHLRARAALAYAASVGNPRSAELRKIASAEAAAVGRSQLHPAYAIRAAIEYGLAASSGNRALAQQHCESALVGFDRVGMSLAREATRLRLATICLDRERGQQLTKQARSAFAAAGVKNADAMTRLLMPGEPPLPLPA